MSRSYRNLSTRNLPARTAVRLQLAGSSARGAAVDGLTRRVEALRADGEAGAQAAEYAMLGGVSAGACGALLALLRNPDFLQRVVDAVLGALVKVVKAWF